MKIKAQVQSHVTKKIEVTFPCYIHHGDLFDHGGGYDKYIKYEADGSMVSITEHNKSDGEVNWEYERHEPGMVNLADDLGYHLVEHGLASSATAFYKALDDFTKEILTVPKQERPVAGQTWYHLKSGHVVTILHISRMQHRDPKTDMQEAVVYTHDGNVWARLLTEFMDGRFIKTLPTREAKT